MNSRKPYSPIRVLHFADIVNRYDFIDNIVQLADPTRFFVGVCVRTARCNIAEPVYMDRTPRWVIGGLSRWSIFRASWQLACMLRQWKADILHVHHYDQGVIGWLATRLCPRTRLVVGRHYSDAIYRSSAGLKKRVLLGLEHLVNLAASRIIVPSTYIWDILANRQHVDPVKLALVPYGFVPEKYSQPSPAEVQQLRRKLGCEDRFVLANFARLYEDKGQCYLIEAVASLRERLPSLQLLVVGEGAERAALERQIATLGLGDRVRLLGWRRDAMKLMAAADAVVQPTLQEAFSQVMVEALWMRKPLIMTDVSGAPDVITNGQNGVLVPQKSASALAHAIEMLAGDPAMRQRLGDSGRAYAERNLTARQIIPRYEEVYERVMEQ